MCLCKEAEGRALYDNLFAKNRQKGFIPDGFMIWVKDAKLFFIKAIYKNHCVALATELFFKEVLVKKGKHIGLNYISIWY